MPLEFNTFFAIIAALVLLVIAGDMIVMIVQFLFQYFVYWPISKVVKFLKITSWERQKQ